MHSLSSTATRAVRLLLDQQPNTTAKIAFAWTIAAGPALARASRLDWATDGTLRVQASSDNWRRELRRARPTLAARLAELLGPDVVRKITIG
jgi:predicted nucleic acid-binding Zn ribbon protein